MKIINLSRYITTATMELDVDNLTPSEQNALDQMYRLGDGDLTEKAIQKAVVFAVETAKLKRADAAMIGGYDIIMPRLQEALIKAGIKPVIPIFSSIEEFTVDSQDDLSISSLNTFKGWIWPAGEPKRKGGRFKITVPFFKKKVAVATEANSLHAETQEAAV